MSMQDPTAREARIPDAEIDQPYADPQSPAPLAQRPPEQAPLAPRPPPPPAPMQPLAAPPKVQPGPRTSETTGKLALALALAQLEFAAVQKTRTAEVRSARGAYKYKYANLADVMVAVEPALKKHRLVPMQIPMGDRVYVRIIHGDSGEWIEGGLPLVLPDYGANDTQRMGSALTYTRRYLLSMMLGIVAGDEDDDGSGAA